MSKNERGFTVIELLVVTVILITAGVLVYQQRGNLETMQRDRERKIAINAMYYSLEDVYYKANGSYPASISPDNLKSMDPSLFTDPDGTKMGDSQSNYRYEPLNCEGNVCKSYMLRADLEQEADFTKRSLH